MPRVDYDAKTLRTMFGKPIRPTIAIKSGDIVIEAQKLAGKLSISGIQPKLSVRLEGEQLVSVAREGQYILKPQTQAFPELPQNEYLCMTMGERFGLRVAPCLLLELDDGAPAYLVKRFDRFRQGRRVEKRACEDMHQILGGPDKYAGSHEQIAQVIRQHCTFAPLELQRFFELTIFNFAIGNGDAHRKNFSLLTDEKVCEMPRGQRFREGEAPAEPRMTTGDRCAMRLGGSLALPSHTLSENGIVALSPAYDLVSSRLVIPHEAEELALAVNRKRHRLRRPDFLAFASHLGIASTYMERKMADLLGLQDTFVAMIAASQLTADLRAGLTHILAERLDCLR